MVMTAPNVAVAMDIIDSACGQSMTHGKLMYFPDGWNGYKYWFCYTPYPGEADENPSVQASNDLITWVEPTPNPIVPTPATGYNSDPSFVYRADLNRLEMWWREYPIPSPANIRRIYTTDGINWSQPEVCITSSVRLSPCVFYEDGIYLTFGISSGEVYFSESATGISDWSESQKINIEWGGLTAWHLDVIHTDLGYELLISAYVPGEDSRSCDLYWCVLPVIGGSCSNPTMCIQRSLVAPAMDVGIYRSTFIKVANEYTIIYAGIGSSGEERFLLTYGQISYL
jgi:hypothetical protein